MKTFDDRSLRWLARRLARLGPGEIGHRLGRQVWWARHSEAGAPMPPVESAQPWLAVPQRLDPTTWIAQAERVLAGEVPSFGGEWERREEPLQWNRDAASGRVMASVRGDRVPFRRPDQHGDIRRVWETNRHHQLVWLAQAYALTTEDRFLDGFVDALRSFFAQCPFPRGPAWSSALEVGVRLASWSAAWQWVGDVVPTSLRTDWLDAAARSLDLLANNLSLGSSANNHLLGELGGLVVGAATWRPSELARWVPDLERELLRQIAPDGSGAEGSFGYLGFIAGWGVTAGVAAGAQGQGFSPDTWARLAAAGSFLRAATVGGATPNVGDDDTGQAVQLGPERLTPARVGVLLGEILDAAHPAGATDDPDAAWLTSAWAPPATPSPPARTHYPDAGHLWLDRGPTRALLLARAASESSLDAHAHADALSLLLWHDGVPLLVDSGTGSYLAAPAWRAYFRGTSAHSTATIDGLDSSVGAGAFQWQRLANTTIHEHSGTVACASHDGFSRLADPVTHRRTVTWRGEDLIVQDHFACAAPHTVALHWQLAPGCAVQLTEAGAVARVRGVTMEIQAASPLRLARGQLDPRLGWHSDIFGRWAPSPTVVQRTAIDGATTLRTVVRVSRNAARACPD